MKILKKNAVVALLLLLGVSSILAQNHIVIGTVSGEQRAGETFELYESSLKSLYAWKYLGTRDKRVTYTEHQIYEICLKKALQQYGKDYPNLYLEDFHMDPEIDKDFPDEEYYTNEVGTGNKCKKKSLVKRIYRYSATVVVDL